MRKVVSFIMSFVMTISVFSNFSVVADAVVADFNETKTFDEHKQASEDIVESPYVDVEFIPGNPLVIDEYTNGDWSDCGYGARFEYSAYDVIHKESNIIKLIKNNGETEEFVCNGWVYLNSDDEILNVEVNCDTTDWAPGKENVITFTCVGLVCEVNITINENNAIIYAEDFIAEKVSDDSCIILRINNWKSSKTDVLDIPETVGEYSVVGIDKDFLKGIYGIAVLNLPSTITQIPGNVFENCYVLQEINVHENNQVFASVNGVLYNKAFTEIIYFPASFTGEFIIKAGVTQLPAEAISGLDKVASIEIEEGNTAFAVEDGILYNGDFTKIYKAISVDADYVMKSTVKEIGDYAFSDNTTLKSVVFAPGVTVIPYGAFDNCTSLISITLPESLVSIEDFAFHWNTALERVDFPATTVSVGESAFFNCKSLSELNLNKGLQTLGDSVFYRATIEKVTLPDSLCDMGISCFMENGNLTDVTIGKGLTYIPENTFYGCGKLEKINIPENITIIDSCAFSFSGLTAISLHDKVTKIDDAFSYCSGLTEVNIVDSVTSMNGAFSGCENLTYATVGCGVKSMDNAFSYCKNLEKVDLAEGVSGSAISAFSGCEKLSDIKLPSTITEISYKQFSGCEKIKTVDIPDTVYKVDASAFNGTQWYKNQGNGVVYLEHVLYTYKGTMPKNYNLVIKSGAKSIAQSAFENQNNLVGVDFTEDIEYIGAHAFAGCAKLKSVAIPDSVEYIGEYAFGYARDTENKVEKYKNFKILGFKDSSTQIYAEENGFEFVVVDHIHRKGPWITDKNASCTKGGSKHKECTICKEVLETATIPAKGHRASNWIVSKKATENAVGSKYQKCTVCAVKLKTEKIPQLKCATPKLKSVENVATGVKITWNKVTGADSYTVYRKKGNGSWKAIKGSIKTTYFVDVNAKSGTTYKYTVKAKNEVGFSGYNTKGLTIKCIADPVLKVPASTKTGITLKWNKVTGAQGYVIYRKTGNGNFVKFATVKGATKASYTDKKAKKGVTYTYKIKAHSGNTYSAFSNAKTIKDKY